LGSSSPTAQPPDPHVPFPCGAAAGVATCIHDAGTSRHATSLTGGEIAEQSDLGAITRITVDNFPTLDRELATRPPRASPIRTSFPSKS